MPYLYSSETPDAFIAMGTDGKQVTIAKAGLSPQAQDATRAKLQAETVQPAAPANSGGAGQGLEGGTAAPVDAGVPMPTQQVGTATNTSDAGVPAPSPAPPPPAPEGGTPASAPPLRGTAGPPPPASPTTTVSAPQPAAPTPSAPPVKGAETAVPKAQTGGIEREMRNAFALQQKAANEAMIAGQAKANEEAAYKAEAFKQQVSLDAQNKEITGNYERERQQQMQTLQNLVSKLSAPDEQINANRWWDSRSTGQKVAASIGMALGAFGGGTNKAADIINHEIDQDIALQKDALDRKDRKLGAAVTAQSNMLGLMRDNFKDDILANSAAKAALLEQVKSKVDYLASKYQTPELQAKADEFKGKLQEQQAQAIGAFQQRSEELGLKRAELDVRMLEAGAKLDKAGAGKQLPAAEAKDLGNAEFASHALDGLWAKWKTMTGPASFVTKHLPGTSATYYTDAKKDAATIIGTYLKGRAPTGSDIERYEAMMPDASDGEERAMLKKRSLSALIKERSDSQKKAYGNAGYDVSKFTAPTISSFRPDGG